MTDENDFASDEIFTDAGSVFLDPTGEYPPALLKAFSDPFDYALGLRNGQVIHFSEARLKPGKWIELIGFGDIAGGIEMSGVDYHFPRGLDVRLSDIVWVADAPNGS